MKTAKPVEIWKTFKADRPGKRFQHLHENRQKQRSGPYSAERIVNVVGGIAVALVGVLLIPAPGPGWLVVALGLGLLGCEFLVVARFLDAAELKVRSWLRAIKRRD